MKKGITLYNVLFPIWFLILFPIAWIVVLPANFIIDSTVLLISFKLLKQTNIKTQYKHSIIRVWVIGFASDFIGAGILFLSSESTGKWNEYLRSVSWNPFDNWLAFFVVAFAVIVSGVVIFIGNLKFSFGNTELSQRNKRIAALALAIFTAPYILFYPSSLMNGGSWNDLKFFTNHFVRSDEFRMEVALDKAFPDITEAEPLVMYGYEQAAADAINEAAKTSFNAEQKLGEPGFTLIFYNRDYSSRKEIPVWIDNNQGYFKYDSRWYAMDSKTIKPFLEGISDVTKIRGKCGFTIIPDPRENLSGSEAEQLDKDGKAPSDYPVFENSKYLYYCTERQKFDGAMIKFEGRAEMDIYTALETGLVTPQELMSHGIELIAQKRK
jgi:hypothetical protein